MVGLEPMIVQMESTVSLRLVRRDPWLYLVQMFQIPPLPIGTCYKAIKAVK